MNRVDGAIFVSGLLSMGYGVICAIFLKFWARTRERLFINFSIAFGVLAVGQAFTALLGLPRENQAVVYLPRLAAFALILIGVARKNLADRP